MACRCWGSSYGIEYGCGRERRDGYESCWGSGSLQIRYSFPSTLSITRYISRLFNIPKICPPFNKSSFSATFFLSFTRGRPLFISLPLSFLQNYITCMHKRKKDKIRLRPRTLFAGLAFPRFSFPWRID